MVFDTRSQRSDNRTEETSEASLGNTIEADSNSEPTIDESKRDLMKKVGGTAALGTMSVSLSGCLESLGSSSSNARIKLLTAPSGFMSIIMNHLYNDTNTIYEYFEEQGLDVQFDQSWEGAAIFASGGADYETFGSLECAMLATERDVPITVNANLVPQFILTITNEGSKYDPKNAGGSQKSVDAIVKDQALYGLPGWGGSTATALVLAFQEGFGYNFSESEKTDFNITTAEWNAVPGLLQSGDLAVGNNSPEHGMAREVDKNGNHPFATIFQIGQVMKEVGFGLPQMNSWACSQEITDKHPNASPALVQAYYEGIQWLFEDPIGRVKEKQEKNLSRLGVEEVYQAQWLIDWGLTLKLDNEIPIQFEDIELTDEFIETDSKFLDKAQEAGYMGKTPWNEVLKYRKVKQK